MDPAVGPNMAACLLLLIALPVAILAGGEVCDYPPPDSNFMVINNKCNKLHGADKLCWFDCLAKNLHLVTDKGKPDIEGIDKALNALPDGLLKVNMFQAKKKCLKKSLKIDLEKPRCQGYMKVGLCIKKVIEKDCSKLLKD